MIHTIKPTNNTTVPQDTADRIKKMKEVAQKVWLVRYAPEQAAIKLEDIPF